MKERPGPNPMGPWVEMVTVEPPRCSVSRRTERRGMKQPAATIREPIGGEGWGGEEGEMRGERAKGARGGGEDG